MDMIHIILSWMFTWWMKASAKINGNLIQNNSWSGSTIGYTGYNDSDCSKSSSFIYRYRKLKEEGFFEQNTIDTVFVFGGTNDSWSDAPLGEMKLSNWVEKDLFQALPAIYHFVCTLKENLPNAEIVKRPFVLKGRNFINGYHLKSATLNF